MLSRMSLQPVPPELDAANQECLDSLRRNAYGEYLCLASLKPSLRPGMLAVMALDLEVRQIAIKAQEEMIAHIRFAWWRENLAALATGQPPRHHPVLLALSAANQPYDALNAIIDEVQDTYPAYLPSITRAAAALLKTCPNEQASWEKRIKILTRHRARHGNAAKMQLLLRLWLIF